MAHQVSIALGSPAGGLNQQQIKSITSKCKNPKTLYASCFSSICLPLIKRRYFVETYGYFNYYLQRRFLFTQMPFFNDHFPIFDNCNPFEYSSAYHHYCRYTSAYNRIYKIYLKHDLMFVYNSIACCHNRIRSLTTALYKHWNRNDLILSIRAQHELNRELPFYTLSSEDIQLYYFNNSNYFIERSHNYRRFLYDLNCGSVVGTDYTSYDSQEGYFIYRYEYSDQMPVSDLESRIGILNSMIEYEGDRTLCKKILEKHSLTSKDCLNVRNVVFKTFYDNCSNYKVILPCIIVGNEPEVMKQIINQVSNMKIKESKNFNYQDYIISDWVHISKFLNALNKIDKGQQHKNCGLLIKQLNDKWCPTFYHNSNNDCRHLIVKFRSLNINSRIHTLSQFQRKLKYYMHLSNEHESKNKFLQEYEDQMFSFFHQVRDTVNSVHNTSDTLNEFVPQFANSLQHSTEMISNVGQKIDQIATKFLSILNTFESSIEFTSIFITLMKFASFGYLIEQKCNQNISNAAALISLILPTGVGNSLMESLTRAVMGIIRYFTMFADQIGEDESPGFAFGKSIYITIKLLIKSVMTGISKESFDTFKANTYYLKTVSDLLRSSTTIASFFIKVISITFDYIIKQIMEYYGYLPLFLKNEQFEKIIDEYIDLKKKDVLQTCGEDIIQARKVIKLRNQVLDIEADMNRNVLKDKTLVYKISPYIRIIATELNKAYDDIPPQFKDNCNAHRIKPFFVYISGPPRIGKSKIFQPILVNYLARLLGIIKEYQDPQHYCCFRTAGREFWDGGQGKQVIWYNDIFQGIMNENGLDLALEEIACVVDDNPYHMNMSDVKDKARCYLQASLVVANAQADTTNAEFLNARLWSHGEHLARRRDINCKLELNPRWRNQDGSMKYNQMNNFIIKYPEQCYGIDGHKMFPKDFYIVTFMDVTTGAPFLQYDFEHAIEYIGQIALAYQSKQDLVTTRLRTNMELLWQLRTTDQMYHLVNNWIPQKAKQQLTYMFQNIPVNSTREEQDQWFDAHDVPIQHRAVAHYFPLQPRRYRFTLRHWRMNRLRIRPTFIWPQDNYKYYQPVRTTNAVRVANDLLNNRNPLPRDVAQLGVMREYAKIIATCIMSHFTNEIMGPHFLKFAMFCMKYELSTFGDKIAFWLLVFKFLGYGFANYKLAKWLVDRITPYMLPYLCYLIDKCEGGINAFIYSFDQTLQLMINSTKYTYGIFMTFVENASNMTFVTVFDSKDIIIKSYYDCLNYLSIHNLTYTFMENAPHWLTIFKTNALQAYRDTYNTVTQIINKIPGWMILTAGAALLGTSAYLIYNYYKSNSEPQSHEGNMKAKRRRVLRKLGKKQTTSIQYTEHSYDNTNREIERILRHSYVFIQMEAEVQAGTWVSTPLMGMALNIKSNIFVMPYHYWYRFEFCHKLYNERKYPSRLRCSWSAKEQTCAYFDMMEICQLPYSHSADLVFLRIKNFNCGRDISHFFVSENDEFNVVDSYLYGYRPRDSTGFDKAELLQVGTVYTISTDYHTSPKIDCITNIDIPTEYIHYDYCFQYTNCLTGPGDCCMALMHTDSKITPKVYGLHTAGNKYLHTGISAPIYSEDIKEVVAFFSKTSEIISLEVDEKYIDYSSDLSPAADVYIEEGFNVVANTAIVTVGNKQRRIRTSNSTKNKVQTSLVHEIMEEDFGPTTVAPTRLGRGTNEKGQVVSPFFKAFKKLNNFTKTIPQKLHDDIVEHCTHSILSWPTQWNKSNQRLLMWSECINGFNNLKGLDLSTSSGFPFNMVSTNKKRWFFFENGLWNMNDELMNIVLEYETKLEKGIIPPIYFIDTLKDELRPIDKVNDFKTRMFQVGNMAWTILFRKYFGWFMGHCQSSYEFGEMMSGINPNSYDWDLIARKMIALSRLHDNGDYSDYDSTLGHQACTGLSDSANFFYTQGELNNIERSNRIRHALILGSINTFHIVEDFVIMRRQGNPSGFFLTTIINNFCNMYYNRYAFVKLTQLPLNQYREKIYSIFFGDDKNATIHESIMDQFNMLTYQELMKELGLKYTSASKNDITEKLITLEEITFLKRHFIYDQNMKIWKSQLDHKVIMEIPRWSEGDPTNVEDQTNRFNACLLELANYSFGEFNTVRGKFVQYIFKLQQLGYNFDVSKIFSYEYCCHIMYPKHYPSAIPLYDLANLGKQQDLVLHIEGTERNLGKVLNYIPDIDDVSLWTEQQCIAQNLNIDIKVPIESDENKNEIFVLTKKELRVLKIRIAKSIQKAVRRVRPILRATISQITKVAAETCPCAGSYQIYQIVSDMAANGELWTLINSEEQPENENVEQGIDDDQPVQSTIEKQQTTTFIDINTMHVADRMANLNLHAHRVFTDINFANFLDRPYLINSSTWISTQALYASFYTLDPLRLLLTIPSIRNKLQNIAWMEPDIEITIRANTTIFHYGALCFNWVPQTSIDQNGSNTSAICCLNSKNWTQLMASSRQVLRFTIPYTHYKNKITIGYELMPNGSYESYVTLYGYVSWPLSTAQTGVVAPVNVSTFARFLKPRLSGFTQNGYTPQGIEDQPPEIQAMFDPDPIIGRHNPDDVPDFDTEYFTDIYKSDAAEPFELLKQAELRGSTLSREKNILPGQNTNFKYHRVGTSLIERLISSRKPRYRNQTQGSDIEAQANSGGLISQSMLAVADFVGKFSLIPFIGAFAAPMSTVVGASGYFAKWMGFSCTPNLTCTEPMQIKQPHPTKIEDTPLTQVLCPNDGLVAKDFRYVNSFPDEMSVANFVGTPQLIYTGQVLPTYTPGQILFRRAISPREFIYADYMNPATGNSAQTFNFDYGNTYTSIASSYASAWRGSFKFDITFICTQFHSMRAAFIYEPYAPTTGVIAPTITTYTNAKNVVMDIQSGQTFSFVIPMDQRVEWLNLPFNTTPNYIASAPLIENNGYVTIMLLNELTSVIALPTSVGIQVLITPMEDFQLLGVRMPGLAAGQIAPQGVDDTEECDYPSSSISCLKKTVPIILGESSGYKVSKIHHACEFTSFRQLANMLTPIDNYGSLMNGVSANNLTWSIYDAIGADCYNCPVFGGFGNRNFQVCAIKNVMALFRYVRGGFRFCVLTPDTTASGVASCEFNEGTLSVYNNAATTPYAPTYYGSLRGVRTTTSGNPVAGMNYGNYVSSLFSRSPLDVTIPWYCTYKCRPVMRATSTPSINLTYQNIYPYMVYPFVNISVQGIAGQPITYLAGAADDFLCGWIMPAGAWSRCINQAGSPDVVPRSIPDEDELNDQNININPTTGDMSLERKPKVPEITNQMKIEFQQFYPNVAMPEDYYHVQQLLDTAKATKPPPIDTDNANDIAGPGAGKGGVGSNPPRGNLENLLNKGRKSKGPPANRSKRSVLEDGETEDEDTSDEEFRKIMASVY